MDQIKENSYAEAACEQKLLRLDLRPYFNFFECPDEAAIGAAIRSVFPSDPAVIFKSMTGRMVGCYQIAANREPSVGFVTFKRKIRRSDDFESIQVPFLAHRSSGAERREGTLVTIVDADFGPAHVIPGREFDSAMSEFGVVVMSTRPQINKDTNMFNGNRMVVVDTTGASNPLPNRLIIRDKSFLLKYKGKKWYCSSCSEEHTGPCPYLKQFHEALEKKRATKVESFILSDSTLRLADHVGIKADISCMPGATVGQLAQAIEECPDDDKYRTFYIAAGANDTNIKSEVSPFVIAKKIDSSLNKLAQVGEEKQETTGFIFFNTTPPKQQRSPLQAFADLYFKKRASKVLKRNIFNAHSIHHYCEPWVEGHPTKACTEEIINKIASDLILDKDLLTTDKLYRGVNKMYVSGCSGCDLRGRFPAGGFCASCMDTFEHSDNYDDYEMIMAVKKVAFDEEDNLVLEGDLKRRRESNGSSDGSPDVKLSVIGDV